MAKRVTWAEDKSLDVPWNHKPGQVRQRHVAAPSERIADGTMRAYTQHAPGTAWVVVAPVVRGGRGLGWQVSMERRAGTGHGRVLAVPCDTPAEVVGTVATLAKRLTLDPPPVLRILLADELDAGVQQFCALVLMASVTHSPHAGDALAA